MMKTLHGPDVPLLGNPEGEEGTQLAQHQEAGTGIDDRLGPVNSPSICAFACSHPAVDLAAMTSAIRRMDVPRLLPLIHLTVRTWL